MFTPPHLLTITVSSHLIHLTCSSPHLLTLLTPLPTSPAHPHTHSPSSPAHPHTPHPPHPPHLLIPTPTHPPHLLIPTPLTLLTHLTCSSPHPLTLLTCSPPHPLIPSPPHPPSLLTVLKHLHCRCLRLRVVTPHNNHRRMNTAHMYKRHPEERGGEGEGGRLTNYTSNSKPQATGTHMEGFHVRQLVPVLQLTVNWGK